MEQKRLKKWVLLTTCLMLIFSVLSGCGKETNEQVNTGGKNATKENTISEVATELGCIDAEAFAKELNEKYAGEEVVLMIERAGATYPTANIEYMQGLLPDITITSKPFVNDKAEQLIKTAYTAGQQLDLVEFWPNQMQTFVNADMALDLTPYLEEDPIWKNSFVDGVLEAGKYNGNIYNVAEAIVYPLLIVNEDLLTDAGVNIKEDWTWEEFVEACNKIQTNTDAFPIGVQVQHTNWLVRCAFEQIWNNNEEYEAFVRGEISFTEEPRIKEMMVKIAQLYEEEYCYPGEGAISLTADEKIAGFAAGEIAMIAEVNANTLNALKNSGVENIKIIGWPTMSEEMNYINGGFQGYFIPSHVKNPDLAVGIMKLLFSQQVMNYNADAGIVPTVPVNSSNEYLKELSKDADRIGPAEVLALSPEISDYVQNQLMANYLLNGEVALEDLENLRIGTK
mgnify:CR=1 FL=1